MLSRNRKPAEIIRLREAEKALNDAQNAYNQRVKQGEKQLKQAQKAHEKAIESAKAELEEERAAFASPIDSFEGALLYKTHLDYQGASLKLDPSMGREIKVEGVLYSPPSNDGDVEDTRKVCLRFYSPSGQMDITVPYAKEKEAHEFANAVVTAAKDSIRAQEEYQKNVALLSKGVEETIANTHAIDIAETALAQDKSSTQSVDAARAYLDQVKQDTPKDMLKVYKRGKAQKKLAAWSVIIILCVIAIALLITWISGGFR